MNKLRSHVLAITLSAGSVSVATAQDFDKGAEAYSAGDYQTALQEWLPLAEQGDAQAQAYVGFLYEHGNGLPQDTSEAVRWYSLSAGQGYAAGQFKLGEMYYRGWNVFAVRNYDKALKWLRLAADQDHIIAQSYLGMMYRDGTGVPQDYAEAVKWYRSSASYLGSQHNLSVMYQNGEGVPESNIMAYMWLYIAASNTPEFASEVSAFGMTSADISKAQELARECMSSNYQNCGGYWGTN